MTDKEWPVFLSAAISHLASDAFLTIETISIHCWWPRPLRPVSDKNDHLYWLFSGVVN